MSPTLRAVLDAHDRCRHSTALVQVLGDGYLYARNRAFRAVRDAFIERGFTFTADDFCDYRSFRLGALPYILEHRRIPVIDTHGSFARLARQLPGSFLVSEIPIAARNHILHEASHCVANDVLPAAEVNETLAGRRASVVRDCLGEAFALANDLVASAYAPTLLHRYLYQRNSYQTIRVIAEKGPLVTEGIRTFGLEVTHRTLMLSSLYGQFLFKKLSPMEEDRLVEMALRERRRLGATERRLLRNVGAMLLASPGSAHFHVRSASFHFSLKFGRTTDVFELTNFDFVDVLQRTPGFEGAMTELTRILATKMQRRSVA